MNKQIRFETETHYLGRNGWGRMLGLCVDGMLHSSFPHCTMYPINSRCVTTRCSMDIPIAAIPELVEVLGEIHKRCRNADLSRR